MCDYPTAGLGTLRNIYGSAPQYSTTHGCMCVVYRYDVTILVPVQGPAPCNAHGGTEPRPAQWYGLQVIHGRASAGTKLTVDPNKMTSAVHAQGTVRQRPSVRGGCSISPGTHCVRGFVPLPPLALPAHSGQRVLLTRSGVPACKRCSNLT